jgi:hypothetical protein
VLLLSSIHSHIYRIVFTQLFDRNGTRISTGHAPPTSMPERLTML